MSLILNLTASSLSLHMNYRVIRLKHIDVAVEEGKGYETKQIPQGLG